MSLEVNIKSRLENFVLDISFESESNRIGILGESGAGKSMLLKYIAGIFKPEEGEIFLDGVCLLNTAENINVRPQDRNIAYMFQNYALFSSMTVRENIGIVAKGDKEQKLEKTDFLLNKFRIVELADKKPRELSGGQQQRVALARVMAYEPKLILLDEPFSALNQGLKERLQIELEEIISDYNGLVIMVSHSRDELYKFSKEIIVVSEGKAVEHSDAKRLFSKPKTVKSAKMVGINNILPARIDKNGFLEIPVWNLKRYIGMDSAEQIGFAGIRDSDLEPVWTNESDIDIEELVIDIRVKNIYETLNERKYYFSIAGDKDIKNDDGTIGKFTFVIDKKLCDKTKYDVLPRKLKFNIENILFFKN